MIKLELLGLQDGQKLALNDSEGNRYVLPITDELRAALRTDIHSGDDETPRPITPREIQAYFRAGRTVAEVSEISSLPPSQLTNLAYPIFAEREYVAQNARHYRFGHEAGGMTVEELVASRLLTRDIKPTDVEWDARREQGEPWMLLATYTSGGVRQLAKWAVNTKAQTLTARNDEAIWLTENQIPAPSSPWRRPNTPASKDNDANERMSVIDAQPAAAGSALDIDSMLASANSKRGQVQPMPEFDGAHPADSEPEAAQDATILAFPSAATNTADSTASSTLPSAPSPDEVEGQQELPVVPPAASKATQPKKRRNRPEMPSWDEIVFGYSKDD